MAGTIPVALLANLNAPPPKPQRRRNRSPIGEFDPKPDQLSRRLGHGFTSAGPSTANPEEPPKSPSRGRTPTVPSNMETQEYLTHKHPTLTTTVPPPAVHHPSMRERIEHLQRRGQHQEPNFRSFLYESKDPPVDNAAPSSQPTGQLPVHGPAPMTPQQKQQQELKEKEARASAVHRLGQRLHAGRHHAPSEIIPEIIPAELKFVTMNAAEQEIRNDNNGNRSETESPLDSGAAALAFPSLRPSSRRQVLLLRNAMDTMLARAGLNSAQDYPSEMHVLLSVIQEEQRIYETVFAEIIRQVTVHMHERGQILAELRDRYVNMFNKIPKQVRSLHTELMAQRKLNRRLSEELVKTRDTTSLLVAELDQVRKHDQEVSKQATEAQRKLVAILTNSDNNDEILEEYHRLYKMQRDRMDEQLKSLLDEKRMWQHAAQQLAIRIGEEHGLTDLTELQRHETLRMQTSNHIISYISAENDRELNELEGKVNAWRQRLLHLSQTVVDEDHHNLDVLAKLLRAMKASLSQLNDKETGGDNLITDFPTLRQFQLDDVKRMADDLAQWSLEVTHVAGRFTSDRDLMYHEEIKQIKRLTEIWVETALKLLHRNERTVQGKEYTQQTEALMEINREIEQWLRKLDLRVAGEDGIASMIITLQNQLEDRSNLYGARELDRPFTTLEKAQLRESLETWIQQIANSTNLLSETAEKEQQKIPLHVENWLTRLLEQMSNDTDVRIEENNKIHNSMVSWMVQLLVKVEPEGQPKKENVVDSNQLGYELRAFNMSLLKDADDMELLSDEKVDLRKLLQVSSDNWLILARRLTQHNRRGGLLARRRLIEPGQEKKLEDAKPDGEQQDETPAVEKSSELLSASTDILGEED